MSTENAESQISKACAIFANNMYTSLSKKQGNVVFSPLSAHICLTMVYQGTSGNTKQEFASMLGIPDPSIAAEGYHSVMRTLNSVEDVRVMVGNKIYLKAGRHLKPNFLQSVTEKLLSEVELVSFSDSRHTTQTINSWVQNKTEQKIEKLFEPDAFTSDTCAVAVNVIYFKAPWALKFKKGSTLMKPFFSDKINNVEVKMMHEKGYYFYKEDVTLDSKILKMDYINNDFSMIFILPNDKDGLTVLESKLKDYDLAKLTERITKDHVIVYIPKFKIEMEVDLKKTLCDMGHVFSRNFSEMTEEDHQLTIDKVVQKVYIEVNEYGTEAAAATAKRMVKRTLMKAKTEIIWKEFTADHPFAYLVTSKQANGKVILFYGSIRDPKGLWLQ